MLASPLLVSAALLPVPAAPQAAAASANANASADGSANSAVQPGAFARELERAHATTADAPETAGPAARGGKAATKRGSDTARTNARPGPNPRRESDRLPTQRAKAAAGQADAPTGELGDDAAAAPEAATAQRPGAADAESAAVGSLSPDPATAAATTSPDDAAAANPAADTPAQADRMAGAQPSSLPLPPPWPTPVPAPVASPPPRTAAAPVTGDAGALADAARKVELARPELRHRDATQPDETGSGGPPRRVQPPAAERAGAVAAERSDAATPATALPRAVARVDETAAALTGTARPGPDASPTASSGNAGGVSFQAELARQSAALAGSPAGPGAPTSAELRLPTPVTAPEFVPRFSAEVAVLARDGVQEARVQLHPAELGPITVQITLEGQGAQVNLAVDNAQTRQLLEQSMPSLAAALRENGLTLTGGGVFEQPRQPRETHPDRTGHGGAQGSTRDDDDTVASIAAASARTMRRQGVVDLYA